MKLELKDSGRYPGLHEINGASFAIEFWTLATDISFPQAQQRLADAKRIVACVNACEGIEDPEAGELRRMRLEIADLLDKWKVRHDVYYARGRHTHAALVAEHWSDLNKAIARTKAKEVPDEAAR